jgi:hypothetical protein
VPERRLGRAIELNKFRRTLPDGHRISLNLGEFDRVGKRLHRFILRSFISLVVPQKPCSEGGRFDKTANAIS